MSRVQLQIATVQYGGIKCRDCGKRLNRKNLAYRPQVYPAGTVELVPICKDCKEDAK